MWEKDADEWKWAHKEKIFLHDKRDGFCHKIYPTSLQKLPQKHQGPLGYTQTT